MIDKMFRCAAGVLAVVTVSLASAGSAAAQALTSQMEEKELPVTEFVSLDVQNDFEVTLAKGAYGVRVTVDKVLSPYVQVYVRAKTLYVSYDSKSVPKDVKKLYRGKNAPTPVFRAVVYLPELASVSLSGNATLSGSDEFAASRFDLTAVDKSQVKNLAVVAESANVSLKKNAQAVLALSGAKELTVNTEGSSNVRISGAADELSVTSTGSSTVSFTGDNEAFAINSGNSSQVSVAVKKAGKVSVNAEGSSKVTLSGEGDELTVRGVKNSSVNAIDFPVLVVNADLAGSSDVVVSVDKLIDATLVGGSSLYYAGEPDFRIGKIIKSTLAPRGTTK